MCGLDDKLLELSGTPGVPGVKEEGPSGKTEGMTGWCRLWIYNYGLFIKPLYALIANGNKDLQWTKEANGAYKQRKEALMSAPALGLLDMQKTGLLMLPVENDMPDMQSLFVERTSLSSRELTVPPNLVLSSNLLSIPSSPVPKLLMKMLKGTGPRMEPCGTPLVTGHQSEVTPFTITLCLTPEPVAQRLHNPVIQLGAGHFVHKDPVKDNIKSFAEVQKDSIN
ncbi:hypothetical protein DUI87_03151 [Hirundo rustica rustica]|uniref:Uncharacterized protein n=1 Tax=Hirundo rustica rustica TaxID=333673 RepID=A0A3M0L202_HIRRU|nr:hypothetical protein DUI87_03151 [Hirundo rustica rustica]